MPTDPRHELPPEPGWPAFRHPYDAVERIGGFDPVRQRRSDRLDGVLLGVVAALGSGLLVVVTWLALALSLTGTAFPRDLDNRYAQSDPVMRQWFLAQQVPCGDHAGTSCCNTADGASAEEDIRGGAYWARFQTCDYSDPSKCIQVEWMQVPADAVLDGPNKRGVATVWWYYDGTQVKIRCYAPGPAA